MERDEIKLEFMKKIHAVEEKCTGHETYGNTTEFFDEDGIVLMTATEETSGKVVFAFSEEAEEVFEFEEVEEDQDQEVEEDIEQT